MLLRSNTAPHAGGRANLARIRGERGDGSLSSGTNTLTGGYASQAIGRCAA
jgi:hypothetical protein